jgi:bacterial/archaeal transporter family-2 protein
VSGPMFLLTLLAAVAGSALAIQVPINAQLARHLGNPLAAAATSFAVGAAILLATTWVSERGLAAFEGIRSVPLWILIAGGCLGAFYVSTSITLVPRIGTAALVAFVIAGQLAAAALIDRFGLLGMEARELSVGRVLGLLAVFGGALLVRFA